MKDSKEMKNVMLSAARAAGKIILSNHQKLSSVKLKSAQDVVTNVDIECENKIFEIIKKKFPDHELLSEEAGNSKNKSDFVWVIDPLDGTVNYANGVPIACTSIALMFKNELILGAVFDPFRNELFHAEKNVGSFLNGKKIYISRKKKLIDCLIGFDGFRNDQLNVMLHCIKRLVPKVRKIRYLGSAAIQLCYAACGRLDCYFCPSLNLWDCAAGILIVRESGGVVLNFKGKEWHNDRGVIISNKEVSKEFAKWLM